jgi:hypothetical protein
VHGPSSHANLLEIDHSHRPVDLGVAEPIGPLTRQQLGVGDRIEALLHVGIYDVLLAPMQPLQNLSQHIVRTAHGAGGVEVPE